MPKTSSKPTCVTGSPRSGTALLSTSPRSAAFPEPKLSWLDAWARATPRKKPSEPPKRRLSDVTHRTMIEDATNTFQAAPARAA